MTAERYKLPKGWVKANFEQCIDIPEGPFVKILRKNYLSQGKFPIIDQSSLFIAGYTDKKEELFKRKLPVIIFGDHTRIFKFVDFYFAIGADGTKILKAKKNIEPKYLFYYLKTIELPSHGYSRHYRYLRKNKILLAPKNEQKRIVEKIEILLDRVNKTKQELAKIPPLIKTFRQSVLAKAFSGELTKEWRGQQESLESASALLARIRGERKQKLGKKYKEPEPIDISNLPELPEGWVYASLPCIVANEKNSIRRGPFGSAIKKAYFVSSGYKVYEQKNAIYNDSSLGDYYVDEKKFNELKDFEVRAGDLIVTCSGTVGRIAVIPKNAEKGIINQALLKISLNKDVVSIKYFINLFSSYIFQSEILTKTRGSAMLNISSVKAWKQILFPMPSLKEQEKIVEKIKEIFARVDSIEKAVQVAQTHCERLNQSILAKAFRGELVEQDIGNEPASMPLEKIKSKKRRMRIQSRVGSDA